MIQAGSLLRLCWIVAPVVAAALAGTSRAQAQNYPWCAQYAGAGGGAMNCGFSSFDQCMETIRGAGGFCIKNDWYKPPATPRASSRR